MEFEERPGLIFWIPEKTDLNDLKNKINTEITYANKEAKSLLEFTIRMIGPSDLGRKLRVFNTKDGYGFEHAHYYLDILFFRFNPTEKDYEKYTWICPRCKDDALILQRNSVGLYFFCLNCKLDSSNLSKDAKGKTISIYAKPDQQGYTKAYKLLTNLFYLVHIQRDKPGDYQPIENGEWDVKLDDNCGYTTKSQDHAEIISRLVKLEKTCKDILEVIE